MKLELPIDPLLPEIVHAVKTEPLVLLEAEPGAGKTTRVPAALLAAGLQDIYVLEPRRLAVRLAARRVAEEFGEAVGERVGYQVRFEEVSSPRTKLWYLTEGVLTRRLGSDRTLKHVKVVILDEFHERHIETDLALALLRKLAQRRLDLRIVIMSATLSGQNLAAKLGSVRTIKASGRVFPVTIRYTPHSAAPVEEQAASAVESAVTQSSGHVLVFLPGAAEIHKTIRACEPIARRTGCRLLPLYGELAPEEQDAAIAQSATRKIICSTNVAESSITIDNVQTVVDSGLARMLMHSPWSGLSRLRIERVSKASAQQRAGRAGRTGPGVVIRLYPESDYSRRPEQTAPEITRADLAQTMLQIAAMNLAWEDLPWLDQPSPEMIDAARELLVRLGAVDQAGRISDDGRRMNQIPVHPRLSRLALESAVRGASKEGAELAARLSESSTWTSSLDATSASDIDPIFKGELRYSARRVMGQILESTRHAPVKPDVYALEKALLCAYPDRVARRRGEMLLLSNGTSARLDGRSVTTTEFLVAVETEDRNAQGLPNVRVASSIEPAWLLDVFPDRITAHEEIAWNREAERVEQVNSLRYDELVINEWTTYPADTSKASDLLVSKALEIGVERFTNGEELGRFLNRLRFAAAHTSEFAFEEGSVAAAFRTLAEGLLSFGELHDAAKGGALFSIMQASLPMRLIDVIAPASVVLANGRRTKIEYHGDRPPSVSSRLQDFFGMKETPTVARGAVRLVIQLLAPNNRPVQVTTDLVSFWRDLYPQVRRELSRRYPRHSWPEVPA